MKVAEVSRNSADLLVAEVGVQDYGDYENKDLADRYGVKKDDFPVVKLFLQNDLSNPKNFDQNDNFNAETLKAFIKQNSGLRLPLDACLEQFDVIAEEFVGTGNNQQRSALLEKAQKEAQSLSEEDKKKADVYIKLMQRVIERGDTFIKSERERVKNILAGKITDKKKAEMQGRLNVLLSFMTAAARDEAAAADAAAAKAAADAAPKAAATDAEAGDSKQELWNIPYDETRTP